ncbi:putative aldo-keto reductase family 1 member C8 [Erethizon dorsatum]
MPLSHLTSPSSAYLYLNEEEVRLAIRRKIIDGTVKRQDMLFSTKVFQFQLTSEDMKVLDGLNRNF